MTTHLSKNINRDTGSFIDTLVKKEYFDSSLYDELMNELNSLIEDRNSEDIKFIRKNIGGLISFTKNLKLICFIYFS